jgi:hypothetical protein
MIRLERVIGALPCGLPARHPSKTIYESLGFVLGPAERRTHVFKKADT